MADDEDAEKASTSPARRVLNPVLWFLKDQWFLCGIAIVVIIASQVQVPIDQQQVKQVTVSYLSGKYLKFLIQEETLTVTKCPSSSS